MIENRNTRHPRIVRSAIRKADSLLDIDITKSHLKVYWLSILRYHVSEHPVPKTEHMQMMEISERPQNFSVKYARAIL